MKIIFNDGIQARFKHTDGCFYSGYAAGCGEAFVVLDANRERITEIPLVKWGRIQQEDLDIAGIAITAINRSKLWRQHKELAEDAQLINAIAA